MRMRAHPMVGTVVLLLILSAACGAEKPSPGAERAAPTRTVAATSTPTYRIDGTVYDVARRAEEAIRANDARALIAGSKWDSDTDRDLAAGAVFNMLAVTGGVPRLVSVGCPQPPNDVPSCLDGFVVAFSSLPPGLEERDTRGMVVLAYERRPGNDPVVVTIALPQGNDRRVVVDGGKGGSCSWLESIGVGCTGIVFYPYTTGPVPTPTVPGGTASPQQQRP
jgi:hypothetical protein